MTYDLIILGSGSAGLTAAIYAARKKMNTLVLAKQIGGQSLIASEIENFPGFLEISGAELNKKIREQVKKYGVPIKDGVTIEVIEKKDGIFSVNTDSGVFESRAVIVASGKTYKKLDVPGAKKFEGRGVSFCTICDAPLYADKNTAVIGGGNTALRSAVDLLAYSPKIYILQHRDKFIGDEIMVEKLKAAGKVELLTNAEALEIKGNKFVEGLVYENTVTREKKELAVGGIFVNIGHTPNSEFLRGFLALSRAGEVIVDPRTGQTSVEGVFAAGDVTDQPYKQCIIAAAAGAKAALSAHEYLLKI